MRVKIAGVFVVAAVLVSAFLSGGGPVSCDFTATTAGEIDSQLASAAGGQTICVTASSTAAHDWSVTKGSPGVRVIAQPADQTIRIGSIDFNGSDYITVEGFDFEDAGTQVGVGGTNITLRKNYFHDGNVMALNMTGAGTGAHHITFNGNTVSRISCNETMTIPNNDVCVFGGGYGIYGCSGCHDLTVAYNRFEVGGPDGHEVKSADNIELGGVHDSQFIGNIVTGTRVIEDVCSSGCSGDVDGHSDSWLFWATSSNLTFRDNRVYNGTDWGITGDSSDITLTNNLVVNQRAQACMDLNYQHPPNNMTLTRNTIWSCPGSVWALPGSGSGTGNVASKNLVQQAPNGNCGTWSANDANVMGGNVNCWSGASNSPSFTPTFSNTTNPELATYYIPSNLTGGFATTGYRYAPAGPDEIQAGY